MRILLATAFMLALTPVAAFAHGLRVTCPLNGGKVEVQVFYDDDSDAAKAKVQVVNDKEEVIATGVTDDKGRWSFDAPAAGKYMVHADAGAGHRAKKELVVPEGLPTAPIETATPSAPQPSASDQSTREELTRTPWLKIVIGLTTLLVLGSAFMISMRLRKT